MAAFRWGGSRGSCPRRVITGFLAGAAVDVVIGELPKLTGTSADGDNAWRELSSWLGSVGDASGTTVLVGLASLALIFGLRFAAPAVPGALVLVVSGLVASSLLNLGDHGVALVGDVPSGLPAPVLPDAAVFTDHAATIGIAAFALLLIGFSQTAGDARAFAMRHHYRIDVDQESIAQGMANAGAGLFQGMPVSTSLSASSLNESSGARTPMASLVTGALVVLTLLVLAPLFSDLPKAVLAAVIIDAVIFGMIDLPEFRRLRRVARVDFAIAIAAFVGVLSAGVLAGVVIGVVLSLGWLIYVASSPAIPVLSRQPNTQIFRDADEYPADDTISGVVVLRLDASLFFATVEALENRVREVLDDEPDLRGVVLDLEAVVFIDSQGSEKLAAIHELTNASRVTLRLARVKPGVRRVLDADGVLERIGEDHVHGNVHEAVEASAERRRGDSHLVA